MQNPNNRRSSNNLYLAHLADESAELRNVDRYRDLQSRHARHGYWDSDQDSDQDSERDSGEASDATRESPVKWSGIPFTRNIEDVGSDNERLAVTGVNETIADQPKHSPPSSAMERKP